MTLMKYVKYAGHVKCYLKSTSIKVFSNYGCMLTSHKYCTCLTRKGIYHGIEQYYSYQSLKFLSFLQDSKKGAESLGSSEHAEHAQNELASKLKAEKSQQQDWIVSLQETDKYLTKEEWESKRDDYLYLFHFKPYTCYWYVQIMMCLKHVQTASSLYHYISHKYNNLPLAFQTYYLNILSSQAKQYDEEILFIYNQLKKKIEIFDYGSCLLLVKTLSKTPQWRECLKLLEMANITQKYINASVFHGSIAAAALQDNDLPLFKDMVNILHKNGQSMTHIVYERLQWMEAAYGDVIKTLLNAVKESKAPLPDDSYHYVKDYFERIHGKSWEGNVTQITKRYQGVCYSCGNVLKKRSQMRDTEYTELAKVFLQKSVLGRDVHEISTPEEVQKYLDFLKRQHPFHFVVDGYNMAFHSNAKGLMNKAWMVLCHLEDLLDRFPKSKILLIGKTPMLRWNKDYMEKIKQMSTCFFTDASTEDDKFMIYAALKSGKKCHIITCDFLRDHSFSLGTKYRDTFQTWQRNHHIQLGKAWWKGEKLTVQYLRYSAFDEAAQQHKNGWHIPIATGEKKVRGFRPEVTHWLCLKNIHLQ